VTNKNLLLVEGIERSILLIRGQKVILDADLAQLYQVPTKALNQGVRRNAARFPEDFMFRLSWEEAKQARSHFVTLNDPGAGETSRSVRAIRGKNLKYRPLAFTEQGVAMLSSVLRSDRAVLVNVEIMRAFVRMREILAAHVELARKLDTLERKYDVQFKAVFDAIRQLMTPPPEPKRRGKIGFAREHEE